MSVRISWKKSGAISCPEDLLAPFRNQHDFSVQDVDELLCTAMPMPLARPGARGEFEQVNADVLQPRSECEATPKLVLARRSERLRISRAGRNRCAFDVDLFLHPDLTWRMRAIRRNNSAIVDRMNLSLTPVFARTQRCSRQLYQFQQHGFPGIDQFFKRDAVRQ